MPWQLFGCHTSCKKLSLLTFMLFGLISQNPEALAVPGLTPFRQSNLPEHVSMQATQQNAASLCTPRNAVGFQQSACSECVPATIPGVTNSTRTGKGCGLKCITVPPQSDTGDEHDEDEHGESQADEAKEMQRFKDDKGGDDDTKAKMNL